PAAHPSGLRRGRERQPELRVAGEAHRATEPDHGGTRRPARLGQLGDGPGRDAGRIVHHRGGHPLLGGGEARGGRAPGREQRWRSVYGRLLRCDAPCWLRHGVTVRREAAIAAGAPGGKGQARTALVCTAAVRVINRHRDIFIYNVGIARGYLDGPGGRLFGGDRRQHVHLRGAAGRGERRPQPRERGPHPLGHHLTGGGHHGQHVRPGERGSERGTEAEPQGRAEHRPDHRDDHRLGGDHLAELAALQADRAEQVAAVAQQVESRRRANQARLAGYLEERGILRSDLALDEATDIIWALTSYDVYRALIGERHWPPDPRQACVVAPLAATLLSS